MNTVTRILTICVLFSLLAAIPLSAQLAGTYTVGGDSPDFATLQHAADSLIQVGISGSVEVLVRPGVYTSPDSSERVVYISGPIAGSSTLNRLRFAPDVASGADRSNVILQRHGGTLEDGFVVAIASNHTTIESFTIQVTDSTIGAFQIPSAVWMTENLDSEVRSLLVDGFDLRVSIGIRFTQCTDDMSIVGNEVYRAEWGIEFNCRFADRLRVSDNFVTGTGSHANFQQVARDYGIRIAAISAADARVENNVVDLTDSRTYIALSIDSGPRPGFKRLTVSGNRILNWTTGNVPFGAAQAGIWVVGTSVDTRITNNLVSVTAGHLGTTRPYGIYIYQYYDNVLVAHNTVHSGGTGSAAFSIVQNPVNPNRLRFLNNIAVTETAFDEALRVEGSTQGLEADYNSYHTTSGILIKTPAGSFSTLADWQAQGYDAHSVQKRPEFENDLLDLHLTGSSVGDTDLIGTPLPEVLFDIDGQPRDQALPYMGGDEAVPFPEGQPVARDDNVRVFEETVTRLEVLENDFDDQPLAITSLSTAGILGTATISSDGLAIDYEPPVAYVGRDRFEYTVRDTDGLPEVALVTVDVIAKPADLTVSNITIPPEVLSGESLSFEFTVTNTGAGATRAPFWEDKVILSTSANPADRVADTMLRNPTFLDAGESYTTIETVEVPDGLEGPHFLIVQTDFRDYQEEPDNSNNSAVSGSPIQVNLTPPPDLQVTSLSVPSTAFSGSAINVTYTVSNDGVGSTGVSAWRDVILGIDAEGNTTTLATLSRQGALGTGQSYDRTASVNLPNASSGEYIVRVVTDPTVEIDPRTGARSRGDVFENLLEENNDRTATLDVTLSPPPDLVPVSVSVPQTALAGQQIPVSWTVENQGAGAPFESAWSDRLYLSADQTLDTESDILLGSARISTPPDAGSSYEGSASPEVRNGLSGSFFVFVVGDANGEVFEHTFEDNNVVVSSQAVEITVPPTPDLIVSTVTAPADASAGERIFVSWSVTNAGDVPVDGRWVDRLYLSPDPTFSRSAAKELGARGCNPCSYLAGEGYSTGLQIALAFDLTDGPFFLHVVTDVDDRVYEHLTEGNNVGTSAEMTVAAYPPVDLLVEGLTLSADTVDSGAPITVSWTVRNTGSGTTLSSSWSDRVYLSSDEQLDESDRLLATVRRSEVLGAGAGYDRSPSIATPDNLGGTFFVIVQADAQERVSEEDDANNASVSTALVIEEVAPPDLRPTAFLVPSQAAAGQPITVSWTVLNQGTGPTVDPGWFEGIYLSDVSALTSAARRIGTFERTGGLLPDSTYTDSTQVTIPAFASGSQFVLFETDSGSDVFEGPRETNNVLARQLSIVLNEPSDLVVSSVTSPPVAEPGQEVTIEYTVSNDGTFPASGLVLDAAYVSADDVWDLDDPLVAIIPQQLDLAPGASQKRSMKVDVGRTLQEAAGQIADDLPGVLPGDYRILVRTDVRNAIREVEDGNNVTAAPTTTTVTIDELRLDEVATFDLTAGQSQYFVLNAEAGQDLRLSLTSGDAAAANDIYVAFERVPGREDFDFGTPAPNEADQELLVPASNSGTYYILVRGRAVPSGTEAVALVAGTLGFGLASVKPEQGGAGGRATVTIRGAGLSSAEFFLVDSSGFERRGDVLESNSVEVRVQFDLTDLEVGTYDVVAQTEGTEGRLAEGFEIVPPRLKAELQLVAPEQVRDRGRGQYSVTVRNTGNVDVDYFVVRIFTPDYLNLESVSPSAGWSGLSSSIGDLLSSEAHNSVEPIQNSVLTSETDAGVLRLIPLIGKELAPGTEVAASLVLSGFRGNEFFPVTATIESLTGTEWLNRLLVVAEESRLSTLADSSEAYLRTIPFVRDQRAFADSMIGAFARLGLVRDEIAVSSRFQFSTGRAAPISKNRKDISVLTACKVGFYFYQYCKQTTRIVCPGLGTVAGAAGLGPVGGFATGAACVTWIDYKCGGIDKLRDEVKIVCEKAGVSIDPNDILGPPSFGDDRWIAFDDPLPYTIRFENDPVKATAAAQEVYVTQQLDSTLDWRSFRLGEFGFGEWRFQVPENSAVHQRRIDVRDSLNLYVDFTGGINIATGEAFWRFESVDPLTGELPWFDGFLPPNDTLGRGTGEGFVTYSIKPLATAKTRDIVNAEARIFFDFNEPIDTPPIFNTIDAEPPASMVQPLSAVTDTSNFEVTWSLDDFGGSDAREFTLFASENGGPFEVYRSGIADTSAIFVGDYDKDYSFFVVATDNTGNAEALKSTAEASTAVVRPVGIEDPELPKEFALYQNYPNPFNPTTTIPFDIAKPGDVEITVYDVIGRRVLRADQVALTPGRYRAAFNLSHLASGVYVYRIRVLGDSRKLFEAVNKFVLVK